MKNIEIWDKAEKLRDTYETLRVEKVPLDMISFVELDLRLDLIPYDGLKSDFGADAALIADFSGLYIDGTIFDKIDMIGGNQLNRLRFSIAHELGHLLLHREQFEAASITSGEHLLDWLNEHEGRKYELEREANEFAGRLLVPAAPLQECFDRMVPAMDAQYGRHTWVSNSEIRTLAAERIAPRFGVHPTAIETRFDREGIWLASY